MVIVYLCRTINERDIYFLDVSDSKESMKNNLYHDYKNINSDTVIKILSAEILLTCVIEIAAYTSLTVIKHISISHILAVQQM